MRKYDLHTFMIYQYTHAHSSTFSFHGIFVWWVCSHVRSMPLFLISSILTKMSSQAWTGSSNKRLSDARRPFFCAQVNG